MLAFEECCTKHKKVILIKAKENQKYKSQMPLRKTEETEKGGDGGAAERQRCTEVLLKDSLGNIISYEATTRTR